MMWQHDVAATHLATCHHEPATAQRCAGLYWARVWLAPTNSAINIQGSVTTLLILPD